MSQDTSPIAQARLPTNSAEATNAMIHYYRAEMGRMNAWRSRIDLTSNWAITVVAALLSVSLSTPTAHHGLSLFAMLIVTLLLCVEARRYRFYDVYRMRVRQFERHYFGQLFGPETESGTEPWLLMLAQDLRHPKFRITYQLALRRRLRRNYIWMFLILLFAWVVKLASPDLQDGAALDPGRPLQTVIGHAAIGPVPGWLVVVLIVLFFAGLATASLKGKDRGGEEVHV
ncbi:MAG: DUF2270 domain-containing protein [Candidatus Devosia phytovorans]|uniref:DUF2270 domain-containing protein n=1 Tax=Candidatus Devosia phytovorans TaxID=3121372 RepID=A0AAJ5VV51_9HYPH|nr:DUF2270 domain-containing protein [Devosia sp.]WEK04651.1 MAG: DUF2270 domain-containing protein [Devosia sp.]